MKFKVSVVLTVLNEAGSIETTLRNLLSQSRKPDEIVIVDGGSKDGTIDVIEDFAKRDETVRLIVEAGVNIARGRNIAIKEAIYDHIACVDAGCKPEKEWLEELIKPFEQDPKLDVVAGAINVESFNNFEFYCGKLAGNGMEEADEKDVKVFGRSSAFKKTILEQAGGYPEWLYTAEDTLLDKKLRHIGASIRLAKQSIVHWRPRKTYWKMAKMFYLYGQGDGRIGTNVSGAYYHMRNYLIGLVLLLISFFYPWTLIMVAFLTIYFYMSFYRPIIKRIKKCL